MKYNCYVNFDDDFYNLGEYNSIRKAKNDILKLHIEKKIFLRYYQIVNYYDNGVLEKFFINSKEAMNIINKSKNIDDKYKYFPYHLLRLNLDELREELLHLYEQKKYYYKIELKEAKEEKM